MVSTYEAPSLFPSAVDAPTPPGRGKHGYYRNARGWIVVASTTPSNRSGTEYKGGRFLPQYGEFVNGTQGGGANIPDDRGVLFNSAHEQWRILFQRGGAAEFPVDQLVSFGWHLRPPYKEVTFPQMAGTPVFDLPCPECDRVFSSLVERQVAQLLRQHLTSKVDEAHSYTPADLKELGTEWAIKFDTARTRASVVKPVVQSIEPEPAAPELSFNEEVPRLTAYACAFEGCDWAPPMGSQNPGAALRMHARRHERVTA